MDKDDEQNAGPAGYSFTGLIAPVFAGFSLPAIIVFTSDKNAGRPWHGIILSLLVAATGLFMASIQLTSPLVDDRWQQNAGSFRAVLTVIGICTVAAALFLLSEQSMHQWYGRLALGVLVLGSGATAAVLAFLEGQKLKKRLRAQKDSKKGSRPGTSLA